MKILTLGSLSLILTGSVAFALPNLVPPVDVAPTVAPTAVAPAIPAQARPGQPVVSSVPNQGEEIAPELQEPGVLYIHNSTTQPIQGKVSVITYIYGRRTFTTLVGTALPGQVIEIVAMAPEGYMVRVASNNGGVLGWIRPDELPNTVDINQLGQLQALYQHQQEVNVAIANKTVIRGMSEPEVQMALGKPGRTVKQTLSQGVFETWEYTTYKQTPQNDFTVDSTGQPVNRTYYERVPIGSLSVSFTNGLVSSVQEVRTDPESPGVYASNPPTTPPQVIDPQQQQPPVVYQDAPQPVYVQPDTSYYQQPAANVYYPTWGGYGYNGRGGNYGNSGNTGNSNGAYAAHGPMTPGPNPNTQTQTQNYVQQHGQGIVYIHH